MTSTATLGALAGTAACGEQSLASLEDPEEGHLVARPGAPVFTPQIGVNNLGIGGARDGVRFIPTTYRPGEALPLMVTLHGASGNAYGGIQPFLAFAETARVVLVSPDSRNVSWDRRYGGFGVDSRFLDNALSDTYLRCAIDPKRLAVKETGEWRRQTADVQSTAIPPAAISRLLSPFSRLFYPPINSRRPRALGAAARPPAPANTISVSTYGTARKS